MEVLAERVDPSSLLRALAGRERPVLARHGGRTIVAAEPDEVVSGAAVWDALDRPADPVADHPMAGGWIGFVGDVLAGTVERVPAPAPETTGAPDGVLARYPTVAIIDADGRCLVAGVAARRAVDELAGLARRAAPRAVEPGPARALESSLPREAYTAAVERARELIAAGDCYQVNLTQRLSAPWAADPHDFAASLWAAAGPSSHRAFLGTSEGAVVSASPERLLRIDGRVAISEPIKGTARPGQGRDLERSGKDRAEHVMIVDLVRNDLGRVAEIGSVRVEELMAPLSTPYAAHLVSRVGAVLRPGVGPGGALKALFPAGSVTGCPKVRAIEIIRELEPVSRGPAFGSIVARGADGSLEASVSIRTAWVTADRAHYWSGGAIVWDSDPLAEWREAMAKASPYLAAVGA